MKNSNLHNFSSYALVTGAASGMGRQYVLQLASRGYNVIMVDVNEAGLMETEEMVMKEIRDLNFKHLSLVQDLSHEDAADHIFEVTQAAGCQVDVLVNNAGILYCQGIAETSEQRLKAVMMVHMYTPLMLCRKYLPQMKNRGCGYILNIASLSSWMIWPGIGMYGSTKRFVKDYSRALRIECQKTGVSVTNAYFGAVDTPMVPLKDSRKRRLARRIGVMISAEKAVDKALTAMFRRRKGVMPGVLNHVFRPLCMILPDGLLGWIYRKAKPYLMKV